MKKTNQGWFILLSLLLILSALPGQELEKDTRISGTNIHYKPGDWVSYSMMRLVRSLAVGREHVYFGTTGGVTRYNFYANRWDEPWTVSNGLADNYIITVAYDMNTDYFWCSTRQGVSLYRSTFQRWENIFKEDLGLSPDEEIASIGFDTYHVWLETMNGTLFKATNQQTAFERAVNSDVPVNTIEWFGRRVTHLTELPLLTMSGGYFFDQDGYIKDYRLNKYDVTCFIRDRWNTYWVGSWGAGVGKADTRIELLEMMPFGLFSENVTAVKMDDEYRIWIGGHGYWEEESGITRWDSENNEWIYFQSRFLGDLKSDQVSAIALDEPYVWFATDYGVAYFNDDENEWRTFDTGNGLADNIVNDVETDGEIVWMATEKGVSQLIKANMGQKDFRIMDFVPRDIHRMAAYDIALMSHLLWIGTEFGLYVYDLQTKTGGFENESDGPQNNAITVVECFQDKEVWVGFRDGIQVFDVASQQWLGSPERQRFDNREVNFIEADDHSVWVATTGGALRYDRDRKRWIEFTTTDGLISNHVNAIMLDGDYVWFGTDAGLTKFYWNDPNRID